MESCLGGYPICARDVWEYPSRYPTTDGLVFAESRRLYADMGRGDDSRVCTALGSEVPAPEGPTDVSNEPIS